MTKDLSPNFYGHDIPGIKNDPIDDEYLKKFPFGKNLDGTPAQPMSDLDLKKYPFGKNLDGSPAKSWPKSDRFKDIT